MPTNVSRSQQSGNAAAAQAALAKDAGARRMASDAVEESSRKVSGYGLPCSKCHLYYPADLDACPTCHHKERVSPVAPKLPIRPAQAVPDLIPDSAILEQEREEFLRQFKSHMGNEPEFGDKMREAGITKTADGDTPRSEKSFLDQLSRSDELMLLHHLVDAKRRKPN